MKHLQPDRSAPWLAPRLGYLPLAAPLLEVLAGPTGISSAGYPYLEPMVYERFRDRVPHLFAMGQTVLDTLGRIEPLAQEHLADAALEEVERGARVVRVCVLSAAVTSPSDLWLLRHVLATFRASGLAEKVLAGERLDPADCQVELAGKTRRAKPEELQADLSFLLSRGYLQQDEGSRFVAPWHPRARHVLRTAPSRLAAPADVSRLWQQAFAGERLTAADESLLSELGQHAHRRTETRQNTWIADLDEIELGYRLLPVVLGLRAAGRSEEWLGQAPLEVESLAPRSTAAGYAATAILAAAAAVEEHGSGWRATGIGRRIFERGAGPMGIIEAYHPYLSRLAEILVEGRGAVWVTRSANIVASQDANRRTFERANDALDAFCTDTGFTYQVYIEHAIGRGEATRQRFARSGEEGLRYVGADLEDAAIDACEKLQQAGRLPSNMAFVRQADIGRPELLVDALEALGLDPEGAVMMVGNGFHEVRDQTDQRMVEIFRRYAAAGLVLLFTEESALSVDDLLATAWNTYHAGFKYVHEKSGQGLRPAEPAPLPRFGQPLRASWSECAERAGYVRSDTYSSRSRTIYPSRPGQGHNPAISVNHFFLPRRLADRLRIS